MVTTSNLKDLLVRPCLISFVAIARMLRTSTIIVVIVSAISSFGGTDV
jgi:hypothetical protein